jgi:sec-independent protein translocase protein TatA
MTVGDIGPEKLLILLVLVLLIFGAKRLPEIGRGLGKGMREFRDSMRGLNEDVKEPEQASAPASTANGQAPERATTQDHPTT